MSNLKYKTLYRQSKLLYGELHPKTLWYKMCKVPMLAPLVLLDIPIKFIKHYCCQLKSIRRKAGIERKFSLFCAEHETTKISELIKPIALYLPQYHTIPENDKWWGKGFTEWTNVKKATPLYEGHYQPHIPHKDIGYYDLSDIEVMRKQARIAKKYGIHGFCFYYYYFANGKRLLEKPINNWLDAKDIDFPFCFAWANENWTRNWNGGNKEIIMPQDYEQANILQMLNDMIPAFKDQRYIKIDKKPILLVYRAEIIPDIKTISSKWRELVKQNGFDDIYLISMQNFQEKNPYKMGFDASVEFAPQFSTTAFMPRNNVSLNDSIKSNAYLISMNQVIEKLTYRNATTYPRIKCICPSWDNTPRRGLTGSRVIFDSSVQKFTKFLRIAIKETIINLPNNGMIFINAWNEWGEGAHLEPDEKYGYQWLETIRCIMQETIKEFKINDKF